MIHSAAQHSSPGSPPDVRDMALRGAILLDVRTPAEFDGGHVPGALNIPVQELHRRLAELGARVRPLLVYCRSGARSASATALLREQGFTQVHDLGGIHDAMSLLGSG